MARQFEHALIVDDSRTARAVLKHMLNKEAFKVEATDSAEKALKHLNEHTTDVIFMDHMMPGMDGFTAVKSIKNDKRLAHIPIVMYTSKDGDVYTGQARALGAAAILSKPATQEQLQLTLSTLANLDFEAPESEAIKATPVEAGPTSKEPLSKPELNEGRQANSELIIEQGRDNVVGAAPSSETGAEAAHPVAKAKIVAKARPATADKPSRFWVWTAAIAALLVVILLARTAILTEQLEHAKEDTQALLEALLHASNVAGQYHSGEVPFAGARIEVLNELLIGANAAGYKGIVVARAHAGLFCQQQTSSGELFMASDGMGIAECDVIGQHAQAALRRTGQQSAAFKAFVANNAILQSNNIGLRIEAVGSEEPLRNYPTVDLVKTAGDWNRVARENNRVVFSLVPKS